MSVYFRDSSLAVSTRILLESGTPYTLVFMLVCGALDSSLWVAI
jgi:hypothetical protein